MKSFSDICKDFFSTNNCDKLVIQLKYLDRSGVKGVDDYTAIGCEFVLNGMNTGNDYYSLSEMIEEHWAGDDKLLNVLKKVSETSDSLLG